MRFTGALPLTAELWTIPTIDFRGITRVILLHALDFRGLPAFFAFTGDKFDFLSFGLGSVTFTDNHSIMNEDVFAFGADNKTITLSVVEPLNCTVFSFRHYL